MSGACRRRNVIFQIRAVRKSAVEMIVRMKPDWMVFSYHRDNVWIMNSIGKMVTALRIVENRSRMDLGLIIDNNPNAIVRIWVRSIVMKTRSTH